MKTSTVLACLFAVAIAMSSCQPLKEFPLVSNSYLPLEVGNEWVYADSVWYSFDDSTEHFLSSNELRFYVKERSFYELGEKKNKGMYEAFLLQVFDDAGMLEIFVRPMGREIYTFGGDLPIWEPITVSSPEYQPPMIFPMYSSHTSPNNYLPAYGIDQAAPSFFWIDKSFHTQESWTADFDYNGSQEEYLITYPDIVEFPNSLKEYNGQTESISVAAGQFNCQHYRGGFWAEGTGFIKGEFSNRTVITLPLNGNVMTSLSFRIHRKRVLKSMNLN